MILGWRYFHIRWLSKWPNNLLVTSSNEPKTHSLLLPFLKCEMLSFSVLRSKSKKQFALDQSSEVFVNWTKVCAVVVVQPAEMKPSMAVLGCYPSRVKMMCSGLLPQSPVLGQETLSSQPCSGRDCSAAIPSRLAMFCVDLNYSREKWGRS